ncbi:MAG: fibronectin type III domain-containing protein [Bacteroidales bacterium]|nr:fibronectin type III domain-containing protein [Bacteroidales bacterium]
MPVLISSLVGSPDVFNYIFEQGWENTPAGWYEIDQFYRDWNNGLYEWGLGARTDVNDPTSCEILENVDPSNTTKIMRSHFPRGTYGTASGFSMEGELRGNYDEIYLTYNVRFKEGFQFVDGGKFPGLGGGKIVVPNPPSGDQGFVCVAMWENTGNIQSYIYHQDQKSEYGEGGRWGDFVIKPGEWVNITMRVVMNDPGQANGIFEAFINGELAFSKSTYRFRSNSGLATHKIIFHSFFGGSGSQYAAERDEYIDFDQFTAFTYNDNIDVPRGHQASSPGRTLILPNKPYDDNEWRNGLSANALSAKSIQVKWIDYPFRKSYTLERRSENEETFTSVGNFSYGTNSTVISGLEPSTNYFFRLKTDTGEETIIAQATTQDPLPSAIPTNLRSVSVTKNQINIAWNDVSNNELGFELQKSVGDESNFVTIKKTAANVSTYNDLSLLPNTNYYYKIRSFNEFAESAYTPVLLVKTLSLTPPVAPSNLTSASISENSVTLNWKDNSNNESQFEIEQSTSGTSGFTKVGTVNLNITSFKVNSLSNQSSYFFRIRAINEDGISNYSNVVEVKTLAPQPPPDPQFVNFTNVGKYAVTINWKDNSVNETGFQVEQSSNPTTGFSMIFSTKANVTSINAGSLSPNKVYYFRIRAFNNNGYSNYTAVNSVNTLSLTPPQAPGNLFVTGVTQTAITINWKDNSTNEKGFHVERSTSSGVGFSLISIPGANVTSFNTYNLTPNTTYYFRVSAFNDDGSSKYSSEISVKTLIVPVPSKPEYLRTVNPDSNAVVLVWEDKSVNETGFEIERSSSRDSGYVLNLKSWSECYYI